MYNESLVKSLRHAEESYHIDLVSARAEQRKNVMHQAHTHYGKNSLLCKEVDGVMARPISDLVEKYEKLDRGDQSDCKDYLGRSPRSLSSFIIDNAIGGGLISAIANLFVSIPFLSEETLEDPQKILTFTGLSALVGSLFGMVLGRARKRGHDAELRADALYLDNCVREYSESRTEKIQ